MNCLWCSQLLLVMVLCCGLQAKTTNIKTKNEKSAPASATPTNNDNIKEAIKETLAMLGRKRLATRLAMVTANSTARQAACINRDCFTQTVSVENRIGSQVINSLKRIKRFNLFKRNSGKKLSKSDFAANVSAQMLQSLGGYVAVISKKNPVCRGRYNTTQGFKGAKAYTSLSNCSDVIKAGCSVTGISPENEQTIADCTTTLESIQTTYTECIKSVGSQCDCIKQFEESTDFIKNCNKETTTLESSVKRQYLACKSVFGECKKLEDASVLFTSQCTTTRNQLESTLNNLYVASDYLSKMKLKSEMIFVTSRSDRVKRQTDQTTEEVLNMYTTFADFVETEDTDRISTDPTISALVTSFTSLTGTWVASASQSAILAASNAKVTTKVADVTSRITEVEDIVGSIGTTDAASPTNAPLITAAAVTIDLGPATTTAANTTVATTAANTTVATTAANTTVATTAANTTVATTISTTTVATTISNTTVATTVITANTTATTTTTANTTLTASTATTTATTATTVTTTLSPAIPINSTSSSTSTTGASKRAMKRAVETKIHVPDW